jgi:nucleoside 2-deoxyribosyltransferase
MKNKVYLSGPIKGLSYNHAVEWREYAKRYLEDNNIKGVSPMRGKEYLEGTKSLDSEKDPNVLGSDRSLWCRDYNDVHTADVLLVNLEDSNGVSIGTVFEIAWAKEMKKPVIVVMPQNNIHNHPFIREATSLFFTDLDDALAYVVYLLS